MYSLACAFGILVFVVPERKEGNLKLLLKYILRQFNSIYMVVMMEVLFGTQNYMITLSEYIKKENLRQ